MVFCHGKHMGRRSDTPSVEAMLSWIVFPAGHQSLLTVAKRISRSRPKPVLAGFRNSSVPPGLDPPGLDPLCVTPLCAFDQSAAGGGCRRGSRLQKSEQRPLRSQSPKRVGSGPTGPPISPGGCSGGCRGPTTSGATELTAGSGGGEAVLVMGIGSRCQGRAPLWAAGAAPPRRNQGNAAVHDVLNRSRAKPHIVVQSVLRVCCTVPMGAQ